MENSCPNRCRRDRSSSIYTRLCHQSPHGVVVRRARHPNMVSIDFKRPIDSAIMFSMILIGLSLGASRSDAELWKFLSSRDTGVGTLKTESAGNSSHQLRSLTTPFRRSRCSLSFLISRHLSSMFHANHRNFLFRLIRNVPIMVVRDHFDFHSRLFRVMNEKKNLRRSQ
jgi:hypothetical protein